MIQGLEFVILDASGRKNRDWPDLALQLRSTFDVSLLCGSLMGAPPQGPGDHMSWADAALGQAHRHTPNLLH